ncbi:phage major capsid protein [Naumannella halotolerans]|uniref:HK97 family phage major capsid protein n=1 Tax=Naumannella halotolerans TaxID=993414 RepID=A0A4R7J3M1_9ACTN|nr:phage major capsid protein [Naumannella halotolerans]TDT31106.1 HK97 family phage major capsid protein [Naumannella halotolerans]
MSVTAQLDQLKADMQSLVDGAKAEGRDLTPQEADTVQEKATEYNTILDNWEKHTKATALVSELAGVPSVKADVPADEKSGSLGDRFIKSEGYKSFVQSGSTTGAINIEAKGIGGLGDLGIGRKATLTTDLGQATSNPAVIPGYRTDLLDEPFTFLDLVTTGRTNTSYMKYSRIVSETDNAAIVPEGQLKPLSDLATDAGEAKSYVYADGFDVTNQTLLNDGALAAYMQTRIVQHVRNKVEDVLLNGDATAGIEGILTTTGVQQQAFDTDVITTIAGALAKIETVQAAPQALVMNPADAWKLALLKEAGVGYLLGNPLAQSLNPTPFGVRLVKSNRIAAGTALVGNFGSVQLLEQTPLSVLAFNQHKDYAQRNMAYVRAELTAMQVFYSPREVAVVELTA